jgi:hypothetical protein
VGEITGRGRLRERTNVVPTSDDYSFRRMLTNFYLLVGVR